jgi:GNAT superfamily N-acetyltransferase
MILKILPLSTCQEFIPIIAEWAYNCWYNDRNIDIKVIEKDYMRRSDFNSLPVTWIAINNKQPVGMISLKERDLLSEEGLSPWLSALYVVPEYQKKGVGSALIKYLLTISMKMNYKKIFLFIDYKNKEYLTKYYEKQNWKYFKKNKDMNGNLISIYSYDL